MSMLSKGKRFCVPLLLSVLLVKLLGPADLAAGQAVQPAPRSPAPAAENAVAGILHDPADLEHIVPASVFFRGQAAPTQARNSSAVRFSDGTILFAAKVDTGGYATSLQERYQIYFVTEDPLALGGASGKTLAPGAYGVGFTSEGFLVMDLGGHTLFTLPAANDAGLRRPSPLQIVASGTVYRLYSGRTYVEFTRK